MSMKQSLLVMTGMALMAEQMSDKLAYESGLSSRKSQSHRTELSKKQKKKRNKSVNGRKAKRANR